MDIASLDRVRMSVVSDCKRLPPKSLERIIYGRVLSYLTRARNALAAGRADLAETLAQHAVAVARGLERINA